MSGPTTVTAAILVIGDEILSGRTKDKNIGYITEYLTQVGIDVREARIVPDVEEEIVTALNALRARYDYVLTTGGIGPTHDDITADSVGRAFGVPVGEDPRILAIMLERYKPEDLTPARRRMARVPQGADLIENPISRVPGFRIGNVYVMAGVPSIMQTMLDFAVKTMKTGVAMRMETIEAGGVPEGRYGDPLAAIAARHPETSIGSYPSFKDGRFANQIVVRGKDEAAVAAAKADVEAMLVSMTAELKPLLTPEKMLTSRTPVSRPETTLAKDGPRLQGASRPCPRRAKKPFPSPGISFIAMRARSPGASPPRAPSGRSSRLPGADLCRRRSWRASSRCG